MRDGISEVSVDMKELKREAKVSVTGHGEVANLLFKLVAAEQGSGLDEEVC